MESDESLELNSRDIRELCDICGNKAFLKQVTQKDGFNSWCKDCIPQKEIDSLNQIFENIKASIQLENKKIADRRN